MQIIVQLIKHFVGLLPKHIRQRASRVNGLVSWYRKWLNTYYFDSYNFDSIRKREQYRQWIDVVESSAKTDEFAFSFNWLIVIRVNNKNLNLLSRTLNSIIELYGNTPKVILQGSDVSPDALKNACAGFNGSLESLIIEDCNSFSDISLHFSSEYYFSLLEAGDTVNPRAISEIGKAIHFNPSCSFFYSDHDHLDSSDQRCFPEFKPRWNLDFFLSQQYIGSAAVIKCDPGEHGSILAAKDDPVILLGELILRKVKLSYSKNPVIAHHIPSVLFHFHDRNADKNYSMRKWSSLIDLHLKKSTKINYDEDSKKIGWPILSNPPLVSIIVPTKNARKLVKKCLESILSLTDYKNYEILLVDNQSDDKKSLAFFRGLDAHPKIRVLQYDKPFNYSAINNYAVAHACGEVIALVNNDIEVITQGWLSEMVSHALRPGVGCVGAKLFYSNNSVQHAGVIIGYGGVAGHAHKYFPKNHPGYMNRLEVVHNVSAVTAACLVVKKSIYNEVGGLDEKNLTVAFNDVDFCLKVGSAGYRNVFTPHALLFHHESVTRGSDQTGEKKERFDAEISYMKQKWRTDRFLDPAYNPNLTLNREDFSLDMARHRAP